MKKVSSKDLIDFGLLMCANVRRLSDRSGQYIGAMSAEDREAVLEQALAIADDHIAAFNPETLPLLKYWDMCLRTVIASREFWLVRDFSSWRRVNSERLLRRVPAIGVKDE